jgi:hypothetical protein
MVYRYGEWKNQNVENDNRIINKKRFLNWSVYHEQTSMVFKKSSLNNIESNALRVYNIFQDVNFSKITVNNANKMYFSRCERSEEVEYVRSKNY